MLTVYVTFPPQTMKVAFRFSHKNARKNSKAGKSVAAGYSDSGAFLGKYSNVTRQHHMLSTISVNMICVKVT